MPCGDPSCCRPGAAAACRRAVAAEAAGDYQPGRTDADASGPEGELRAPRTGAVGPDPTSVELEAATVQPIDTLTERLSRLRHELARLTSEVPEHADTASVESWLDAFRPVEGAVAGLRSRLIACVQASRAHDDAGHAATTSLLREHLGVSGREAKKQDALARDLRRLPGTRAALADGRIGPEQAQAIGRAARRGTLGDPRATEEQLLPAAAERVPEEFERHIRHQEQLADSRSLERAEQRAYRRRRASLARRQDGMWDLHALLPDEDGELLATALDAFRSSDPPGTPIPEQRSPEQRTADALTDVIGASLRRGAPTLGGVRPHLNLVVPVELLDAEASEVAGASHGGQLSSAAVSRLLCDANLRRVLTRGDSEVLDLGRSRRPWTVAQRVALNVRDGGCRGPGCDRPVAWTDGHHIVWWTNDGVTNVDNGILLCRRHHRMVHEGGWSVSLDVVTGLATFRSPTGREVVTQPHRSGSHWRRPPGTAGERTELAREQPAAYRVEVARHHSPAIHARQGRRSPSADAVSATGGGRSPPRTAQRATVGGRSPPIAVWVRHSRVPPTA